MTAAAPLSPLFCPLTFRNGARARNCLAVAPMTNLQSHRDGSLSDAELQWLVRRAAGGFGLVITCAAHVTLDGQGWPGELGVYADHLLPGLTQLAAALRENGALPLVQLFHGGVRAPRQVTGLVPFSASEIPDEPEAPRAASEADLERVIDAFRDAALRAYRAGFAGVELHFAFRQQAGAARHGYRGAVRAPFDPDAEALQVGNHRQDVGGGLHAHQLGRLIGERRAKQVTIDEAL